MELFNKLNINFYPNIVRLIFLALGSHTTVNHRVFFLVTESREIFVSHDISTWIAAVKPTEIKKAIICR